jgi:thiol:disulfide interchange protein DsbC
LKPKGTKNLALRGFLFVVVAVCFLAAGHRVSAFGGCEENCQKCHVLSNDEVNLILNKLNAREAKILKVQTSPVRGLWELSIDNKGQRSVLYLDYSKKYIIAGQIIEVNAAVNKTRERIDELNKDRRINLAGIPLKDALVLGSNTAEKKVIVFTDPDCSFCSKLHQELKKVIAQRMDIAFYLKLYPLKMHADAYWKSKSIACSRSVRLLEDNYENRAIPRGDCNTGEVDENIKVAEKNGITSTPTIIFPDGSIHSGFIEAEKLMQGIDEAFARARHKKAIPKKTKQG